MAINLSSLLGSLQSGTSVAASGTAVDFTGIPSTVKQITLTLSGVSTSGTSIVQVQLGAGSVQTTGYASVGTGFSNTGSSASSTSAFVTSDTTRSADLRSGSLIFSLLGSNTWTLQGALYVSSTINSWCAGSVALSGILDRVRLTTANGTDTFDSGSINIIYQ